MSKDIFAKIFHYYSLNMVEIMNLLRVLAIAYQNKRMDKN